MLKRVDGKRQMWHFQRLLFSSLRSYSAEVAHLDNVQLTVYEKQYFTPVLTCSNLVKTFQTCSRLFTPVHTCSYLFTPVHTSVTTLFMPWQFLVEFSPCESCYFSILRAILLKLHIWAHLIESYPTVHCLNSCVEKISIPFAAHTTLTMYDRHEMSFLHFQKLLFFSLTSYPAEIAYFNLPNQELSNFVRLMELY